MMLSLGVDRPSAAISVGNVGQVMTVSLFSLYSDIIHLCERRKQPQPSMCFFG